MKQITVKTCKESFEQLNTFISSSLNSSDANPALKNSCLLCSEELFLKIIECTSNDDDLSVTITNDISGTSTIRYSFSGKPFDLTMKKSSNDFGYSVLEYYSDKIKYKYKDGYNSITLQVGIGHTRTSIYSLFAIAAAVIVYTVSRLFIPEDVVSSLINTYIWPIAEIYLKCILLFAPLLLYFSVIVSISKYYSTMTRYPASFSIISQYFISSLVAVIVGLVCGVILTRLVPAMPFLSQFHDSSKAINLGQNSLRNILLALPEDIFSPFKNFNSLQLVLLALITGAALGSLGNRGDNLRDISENLTDLFGKIVSIIYSTSPFVIFVAFIAALDTFRYQTFPMFLGIFVLSLLALSIQIVYYAVLLKKNHIDPVEFFKKALPMIKETFKIGSTSNAVPLTISSCEKSFGIPKKFLNISIPLGATNNLDGSCLCLSFICVAIAHLAGADLSIEHILLLGFTSYITSIGIPTQSGSFVLSSSILLSMFGIEGFIIAVPLAFEVFMSQTLSAFNLIGDIVFSNIVYFKAKEGNF